MRQIFFFLAIFLLIFESANAQINEWYSTISRDNPDEYFVVNKEGDSLTINLTNVKNDPSENKYAFKIRQGEGRKKDQEGTR
jgi:ABC-type uncharacterized transport system YnjBCD substrate-binding protein